MKKNPSRYWSTGIEGEWQSGSGSPLKKDEAGRDVAAQLQEKVSGCQMVAAYTNLRL